MTAPVPGTDRAAQVAAYFAELLRQMGEILGTGLDADDTTNMEVLWFLGAVHEMVEVALAHHRQSLDSLRAGAQSSKAGPVQ